MFTKGATLLVIVMLVGTCIFFALPRDGVLPFGDTTRFFPVDSLGAIRAHAGGQAKLCSIKAKWVRSDGSMDLSMEFDSPMNRNYVKYEFLSDSATTLDPNRPIGSGRKQTTHDKTTIKVEHPRWVFGQKRSRGSSYEGPAKQEGVTISRFAATDNDASNVIDDPTCNFAELWKQAIAAGAPSDALAMILYDKEGYLFRIAESDLGSGHRYFLRAEDAIFQMTAGSDCSAQDDASAGEGKPDELAETPDVKHSGALSIGPLEVRGKLSRPIVLRVLRRHVNELRFCQQRQRIKGQSTTGTIKIRFIVSKTGSVQSTTVSDSTAENPELGKCLTNSIKRWVFPAPDGGGIAVVDAPFILE